MARYAPLQRIFHWLMALIILPLMAGGLLIGILGFNGVTELLGAGLRDTLYEYHKTFGLIVLVLMVARLFLRLELGRPAYDQPLPLWQILISSFVHYLMYLALFAMPILGWLATDASDFPVEFFGWNLPQFIAKDAAMGEALYAAHEIVGWVLVGLVALHIGAALKHWLVDRDGVARRMTPY